MNLAPSLGECSSGASSVHAPRMLGARARGCASPEGTEADSPS